MAVLRGTLGQGSIELVIEQGKFESHLVPGVQELDLLRYTKKITRPQRLAAFFYQTKSGNEPVCDPTTYGAATWPIVIRAPARTSTIFWKKENLFEEAHAKALKRTLAEQIGDGMEAANLTKMAMAAKMATSRSQLDRVLDPDNVSIQLDTLIKAARALGKVVEIKIKPMPKAARA